ncbi:MAG: fluoride efflux transporter CrcB [Verrucomicrobiales bacterium]|nr:fluoride efflux transporter CrcB [Verrucomicrobiales bacterium]
MKAFLLVGLGGFLGATSRWLLAQSIDRWLIHRFPFGIFAVNILGCLVIGYVMGLVHAKDAIPDHYRMLFIIGFLGSFTTYSTFSWNTFELFRTGHLSYALANIAITLITGLLAVGIAYSLATRS